MSNQLGSKTASGIVTAYEQDIEWAIRVAKEDREKGKGIMAQLSQEAFDRYLEVLEESR